MSAVAVEIMSGESVRFTVLGVYGYAQSSWPDFGSAVAAARSTIERFDHPGQTPDHTYSRACVALRVSSTYARIVGVCSGSDREVLRWEVFRDRVVLVPPGQGGLTDEQRDAALAKPMSEVR